MFTRSIYSFWGLILGNSMFGTLLPKNDMKIADPSSPNHGSQPLKIPRRYADINYQLRRPDVLANKACYNCATALCDLLGGKEGRFQMRCIRKCMIVSVYTQTLESYISYIFRSFKSLIHMNFRPCMTRMTLFPEHVGWHGRGCRAEIPGVATDPGASADARWRGVTRLPGIVRQLPDRVTWQWKTHDFVR